MQERREEVNVFRWGDRAQSTRIEGYQITDAYRHTHLHSHALTLAFFPTNVSLRFYLVLIYLDFLSHSRASLFLSHTLTHSHTHFLSNHFIPYCFLSLHSHFFPPHFHSLLSNFSFFKFSFPDF